MWAWIVEILLLFIITNTEENQYMALNVVSVHWLRDFRTKMEEGGTIWEGCTYPQLYFQRSKNKYIF